MSRFPTTRPDSGGRKWPPPAPRRLAAALAAPVLVAAVLLLVLAGCSPHLKLYPRLDNMARQGRYAEAAALIEQNKKQYSARNAVLYYLDRGLFLHYAGQYQASNVAFEEAERRMDELFTRSSTRQVGAFLSNDNTLPYRGEDFEAVVINLYRALNYAQLGSVESALVEARKVNEKLTFINSKYEPGKRNVYKEDAFARLLAGILYEMGGEDADFNDAYISNRLAAEAYRGDFEPLYGISAPAVLKSNLLSTAEFMGGEELEAARKRYPKTAAVPLAERRRSGHLYFIHLAGRSPIKVESSINAFMPDGYLLRIAFPGYRRRRYQVRGSTIFADGKLAARLEVAMPLGSVAVKNLARRKGRIAVKAIARATTKYLLTKAAADRAKRQAGPVAGMLTQFSGNILAAASEQADLRSWETLPDRILVGRATVKPGTHVLSAKLLGAGGNVVGTRQLGEVKIKAGETRFFVLHTAN